MKNNYLRFTKWETQTSNGNDNGLINGALRAQWCGNYTSCQAHTKNNTRNIKITFYTYQQRSREISDG